MYKSLTIAIAVLALAAVAHAGVYTHEVPYSGAVPGSQTVQLPKYNGGETLVSVQLFLESNAYAGSITWDNESAVTTDVLLGIGAKVTATAPDATTLVAVPMTTGTSLGVAADNDGGADYIGTDSFNLLGGTSSDNDNKLATNLTPYMGAGNFNVLVAAVVETTISTTGGSGVSINTPGTTDGKVKVVYTTVPEPATMSLLAIGGVAALIRRKK